MRILISVDNDKHGIWTLLGIVGYPLKNDKEAREWYKDYAGTEEALREEITWTGSEATEVLVPHTGVYIANYYFEPHVCTHPECAHDGDEPILDIIEEIPINKILSIWEQTKRREQ
jgi:hypothetical protein